MKNMEIKGKFLDIKKENPELFTKKIKCNYNFFERTGNG